MRVDLPAPFSPIRAWISPSAAVRSTWAFASTPGKRLTMPCSATAAGGSGCCWVIDRESARGDLVTQLAHLFQHVRVVRDHALRPVDVGLEAGQRDALLLDAVGAGLAALAVEDRLDTVGDHDVG